MEEDIAYLRCPRCGSKRKILRSDRGYFSIQPGRKSTIDYLQCVNKNCSKDLSFLVREEDGRGRVY